MEASEIFLGMWQNCVHQFPLLFSPPLYPYPLELEYVESGDLFWGGERRGIWDYGNIYSMILLFIMKYKI
jgi:hypothetical protein